MVNRLAWLSGVCTLEALTTFCSTMVPEAGAYTVDHRIFVVGVAAQVANLLGAGFDGDLGFLVGILGDLQIV